MIIKHFLNIANPEQKELLMDLGDLVDKEVVLAKKINDVYENIGKGKYGQSWNGTSFASIENEEAAGTATLTFKNELADVRKQIAELLTTAVQRMSMGHVDMVTRGYKAYKQYL